MTPKQFKEQFDNLIRSALSESPAPVAQMILELELAKTRCIAIELHFRNASEASKISKDILDLGVMKLKGN